MSAQNSPNIEDSPRAQMELKAVAYARAMVREGMARLLASSRGNTPIADDAAMSLVSALLDCADEVRMELHSKNDSFTSLLETSTTWPVKWYPGERDRAFQKSELEKCGYGKHCPLNISESWQEGPANSWAYDYWKFVINVKLESERGFIDKLVSVSPDNREILKTALELPVLSRERFAIGQWQTAIVDYYKFKFPGNQLGKHPDWKKYSGGVSKICERLRGAIKRISPK